MKLTIMYLPLPCNHNTPPTLLSFIIVIYFYMLFLSYSDKLSSLSYSCMPSLSLFLSFLHILLLASHTLPSPLIPYTLLLLSHSLRSLLLLHALLALMCSPLFFSCSCMLSSFPCSQMLSSVFHSSIHEDLFAVMCFWVQFTT